MAVIPFAKRLLIPPGASDPTIEARVGILHVDAGNNASLYDYFKHRSGGIESHGHIRRDGMLEQYRDTAFQADANYRANDFALSFETQGFEMGEWTEAQLYTIKRVMVWARDAHGIPLRKIDRWDGSGWGYHTLFGAPGPWTPVAKSCPGPDRKAQFHDVLVPWMREESSSLPDNPKPPSRVQLARRKLRTAERRLAEGIELLDATPEDREVAHRIALRLEDLADKLDRLEDRLPER